MDIPAVLDKQISLMYIIDGVETSGCASTSRVAVSESGIHLA